MPGLYEPSNGEGELMNPEKAPDTVVDTGPHDAAGAQPPAVSAAVRVDLAGCSHPGLVRANNEDHYLVLRFDRALQTLRTNLPDGYIPALFEESGYCMMVADGMG